MGVINIIDKLWNYLNGYAIISIEGFNKMKLINNAVKKFIRFSDITSDKIKSTAIIPIEDLKKLNEINKSYKCISHDGCQGEIEIVYRCKECGEIINNEDLKIAPKE